MRRDAKLLAVRIAAALVAGLAMLAVTGTALAQPAGNNGTVKIHSGSTDSEPIIRNEPHVGTFHLHFQFADPAQAGRWQVRTWAPGDSGNVVLTGSYDTAGDGSDRQPAVGAFTLPDGHYKLFWSGRTEANVKHKTFWVENVAAPTAMTSPSAAPTGEELPITGSPPAITPPPTDLQVGTAGDAAAGGAVVVAVMTLAVSAWLAFTAIGGGSGSSRG